MRHVTKTNALTLTAALMGLSAHAGEVLLWGQADGSSTYVENQSGSFFRLDLPDPGTDNQRFRDILNPSITYGSTEFDGFPNDGNFRMGTVLYDNGDLVGDSGTATITGLTLGIGADPNNPAYVNYGRWDPITTTVDTFSGTVTVQNGQVIGINLTSTLHIDYAPNPSIPLSAAGTFTVNGDQFDGYLSGDTWAPGLLAEWDFSGTLTTVPEPASAAFVLLPAIGMLARRRRG